MTQSANLAVKPIPRRARFIAEIKLSVATGQLSDHSFDRRRRAIDLAEISNFTLTAQIGYRQCVLVLRRVNSDKRFGILLHGPPSVHEARLGPPEQPSYSTARPGRAAGLRPHGHNV